MNVICAQPHIFRPEPRLASIAVDGDMPRLVKSPTLCPALVLARHHGNLQCLDHIAHIQADGILDREAANAVADGQ